MSKSGLYRLWSGWQRRFQRWSLVRVKSHQVRAKVAFTKPLTTHLMNGKGDFRAVLHSKQWSGLGFSSSFLYRRKWAGKWYANWGPFHSSVVFVVHHCSYSVLTRWTENKDSQIMTFVHVFQTFWQPRQLRGTFNYEACHWKAEVALESAEICL